MPAELDTAHALGTLLGGGVLGGATVFLRERRFGKRDASAILLRAVERQDAREAGMNERIDAAVREIGDLKQLIGRLEGRLESRDLRIIELERDLAAERGGRRASDAA